MGKKLAGAERQEASIELLALFATVVFGIAGVIAAYYGYKSFRASNEQLELAREQAAQVPRIELMEVNFQPLSEAPDLLEEVSEARREIEELQSDREEEKRQSKERERARVERERLEREKQERQEKWRGGFDASKVDESEDSEPGDWLGSLKSPLWGKMAEFSAYSYKMPEIALRPSTIHVYEGRLPNSFIDVGIRNVGLAAAYDVTGWVWLDKAVLEPIEYFSSEGVEITAEKHGKVKVELSVRNDGGRLFPSHNDPYTFRIAAELCKVADTSFEFEFTSPQGSPTHGTFSLLLASKGSQETDK